MIIGITGLGLIGGSFAKCIRARTSHRIFAFDTDIQTMTAAKFSGIVDENLTTENISQCDLILLAVSPLKAVEWVRLHAGEISHDTTLIDLCGIKRAVYLEIHRLAHEHGFMYVGGHPMAGREHNGFRNSSADLFDGASMILTLENTAGDTSTTFADLKNLFTDLGFANITITTPEEHDKIIAYTSQLPHVISSAYVRSPEFLHERGFSAGSFRDISRVAGIDEKLWSELFMCNRDFLTEQVEIMIDNLNEYLDALRDNDADKIECLLRTGRERKEHGGCVSHEG